MRSDIKFDITIGDVENNSDFAAFLRGPEFSTWLILMSRVWKSGKSHSMGLDRFYQNGLLTSAIKIQDIAKLLSTSDRSIKSDISKLADNNRIGIIQTESGNIYILGEYTQDEGGAYFAKWYAMMLEWERKTGWTGRGIPNDPDKVRQQSMAFDDMFGAPPQTGGTRNGVSIESPQDELNLLLGESDMSDLEREVLLTWGSYRRELQSCCLWFCQATLMSPPKGKTIQSDWIKVFEEHMLEYQDGSLRERYIQAAQNMKQIGYDIHGPRSLTRSMFGVQIKQQTEIEIVPR